MRLVYVAAATLALAGCAHRDVVREAVPMVAEPTPTPVVSYALSDGGSVRMQVLGPAEMRTTDTQRSGYRALQVRMTVTNVGPYSYLVDPHLQVARVGGYSTLLPSEASSAALLVEPGQERTIDLFYPMPMPDYGPQQPEHIAIDWRLTTGGGPVTDRAQFDKSSTYGWIARPRL